MPPRRELAGQKFGRLLVLHLVEDACKRRPVWRCHCDCGKEIEVMGIDLATGNTQSCGCLQRERSSNAHLRHGHGGRRSGGKRSRPSRAYQIWQSMRKRCQNPKTHRFEVYGGRGIQVCDKWNSSFEAFLADMGEPPEGHSIDRIDGNGHYEPGNCRWATDTEQARNRRTNALVDLEDGYGPATCAEQCERTGIPRSVISNRLRYGWSYDEAFFTPINGDRDGARTRKLNFIQAQGLSAAL
jgi:hypothetical protein